MRLLDPVLERQVSKLCRQCVSLTNCLGFHDQYCTVVDGKACSQNEQSFCTLMIEESLLQSIWALIILIQDLDQTLHHRQCAMDVTILKAVQSSSHALGLNVPCDRLPMGPVNPPRKWPRTSAVACFLHHFATQSLATTFPPGDQQKDSLF